MNNIITTAEAAKLIFDNAGQIFSTSFYKKGKKDGSEKNEIRTMRAILGQVTKKGLVGGPPAYDPKEHGLIWVYLMSGDQNRNVDEKHRRSIPVSGIIELAINGSTYTVNGKPQWSII